MRCCVIIQARLGSSRLPAKLALDLGGSTLLQRVVQRVALAAGPEEVVVATSDLLQDDVTADIGAAAGAAVFRGSLEDARDRCLQAARWCKADAFIRVTADNPFVEPRYIEELIEHKNRNAALPYIVHDLSRVVHGTASELVDLEALERAVRDASSLFEKEHITPAVRTRDDSLILTPPPPMADPHLSLSVDTLDDYVAARRIYQKFGGGRGALANIVDAYRSGSVDADVFRCREPSHAH